VKPDKQISVDDLPEAQDGKKNGPQTRKIKKSLAM
jgi:hypothetical protein